MAEALASRVSESPTSKSPRGSWRRDVVSRVLTNSSHWYMERLVPGGGELAPAADKVNCRYHRDIFSQVGETEKRPGRIYESFCGDQKRAVTRGFRGG